MKPKRLHNPIVCTLMMEPDDNLYIWQGARDRTQPVIDFAQAAHAFKLQDIDRILDNSALTESERHDLQAGSIVITQISADIVYNLFSTEENKPQ